MSTGKGRLRCYAAELGGCSAKLAREHFLSDNILQDFSKDARLSIRGFPHGPVGSSRGVSASSMVAKVLCETHNSRLSPLDSEGGNFLLSFYHLHEGLIGRIFPADVCREFDGALVERWMLKAMCGLVASGQTGIGHQRFPKASPPIELLRMLFGEVPLPEGHGLHVKPPDGQARIPCKELALLPFLHDSPGDRYPAYGLEVRCYGFTWLLCLPGSSAPPDEWNLETAVRHPEAFVFHHPDSGRNGLIALRWPHPPVGKTLAYSLSGPQTAT